MNMRRITTVLALTALACGKQAAAPVVAGEYSMEQADSIPLAYGAEVHVGEVWMVLSDVPSDSRCPRGVTCVWAGDAVAAITVHPPCYKAGCKAPSVGLQLHTMLQPREAEGWGHRVRLLALVPEPISGSSIDKATYIAWVRVTK